MQMGDLVEVCVDRDANVWALARFETTYDVKDLHGVPHPKVSACLLYPLDADFLQGLQVHRSPEDDAVQLPPGYREMVLDTEELHGLCHADLRAVSVSACWLDARVEDRQRWLADLTANCNPHTTIVCRRALAGYTGLAGHGSYPLSTFEVHPFIVLAGNLPRLPPDVGVPDGIPIFVAAMELYRDDTNLWRERHMNVSSFCVRLLNLDNERREKVDQMKHWTLCPANVSTTEFTKRLVPGLRDLNVGYHVTMPDECVPKTISNPYGLVYVIGGLLVSTADMPEGQANCNCKKPGATFCNRFAHIKTSKIGYESFADLQYHRRVHQEWFRQVVATMKIPDKSAREKRETELGITTDYVNHFKLMPDIVVPDDDPSDYMRMLVAGGERARTATLIFFSWFLADNLGGVHYDALDLVRRSVTSECMAQLCHQFAACEHALNHPRASGFKDFAGWPLQSVIRNAAYVPFVLDRVLSVSSIKAKTLVSLKRRLIVVRQTPNVTNQDVVDALINVYVQGARMNQVTLADRIDMLTGARTIWDATLAFRDSYVAFWSQRLTRKPNLSFMMNNARQFTRFGPGLFVCCRLGEMSHVWLKAAEKKTNHRDVIPDIFRHLSQRSALDAISANPSGTIGQAVGPCLREFLAPAPEHVEQRKLLHRIKFGSHVPFPGIVAVLWVLFCSTASLHPFLLVLADNPGQAAVVYSAGSHTVPMSALEFERVSNALFSRANRPSVAASRMFSLVEEVERGDVDVTELTRRDVSAARLLSGYAFTIHTLPVLSCT